MEEPWEALQRKELIKHLPAAAFSFFVALFVLILQHLPPLLFSLVLNDFLKTGKLRFLAGAIIVTCLIPVALFKLEKRYKDWILAECSVRAKALHELVLISIMEKPLEFFADGKPVAVYKNHGASCSCFVDMLLVVLPRLVAKGVAAFLLLFKVGSVLPTVAWLQLLFVVLMVVVELVKKGAVESQSSTDDIALRQMFQNAKVFTSSLKTLGLGSTKIERFADDLEDTDPLFKVQETDRQEWAGSVQVLRGIFTAISFGIGVKALAAQAILGGDLLLIMVYLPALHALLLDLTIVRLPAFSFYQPLFQFLTVSTEKTGDLEGNKPESIR